MGTSKTSKGWIPKRTLNNDRPSSPGGPAEFHARFVYATRSHVPDLMVTRHPDEGQWVVLRILKDARGSVRAVVDVRGNPHQQMDYDPYGQLLSDSNPGFQPFGFAGGHHDELTDLVRFGARDYDPRVGQWTAKDPILFGGGDTYLYGYVGGDPVNFIDPSGLVIWPIVVGVAIVAAVEGYMLYEAQRLHKHGVMHHKYGLRERGRSFDPKVARMVNKWRPKTTGTSWRG